MIPNSLRLFCIQRLGFDPAELTEQELSACLPEIQRAIAERAEVSKSAIAALASNRLEFLNSVSQCQETE